MGKSERIKAVKCGYEWIDQWDSRVGGVRFSSPALRLVEKARVCLSVSVFYLEQTKLALRWIGSRPCGY